MKCPKCEKEIGFETVTVGENLKTPDGSDLELVAKCPNKDCDQRFYTFVHETDWSPLEQ